MNKSFLSRTQIRATQFIFNHFLTGTHFFAAKRHLLRSCGIKVGDGTKIVGPILFDFSELEIGRNCWIGKNFEINGHGSVLLEDNVSIGPNVVFYTGKHLMGPANERHAGQNLNTCIRVKAGSMVCASAMIAGPVEVGKGAVVMVGSCVTKNIDQNMMVGGVPAKVIKLIED